ELPERLAIQHHRLAEQWGFFDAETVRRAVEFWSPFGALMVALLMVSRVPYPHVTKQILRGRRHFSHLVQVILVGFIIMLIRDLALVLIFWIYALGIPLRYLWLRQTRRSS